MLKNPYLNAVYALVYIIIIVLLISVFSPISGFFVPVILLSLFVLSAAVMGTLFLFNPIRLFLEDQKHEAIYLFLKTIGAFAVLVFVLAVILLISHPSKKLDNPQESALTQGQILFPAGGEKLVKGQSYELKWKGGPNPTQIFLIDTSLKDAGVSVSIADRIYNISNNGSYNYLVPKNIKDGQYELQIGDQISNIFEIASK